MIDLNVTYCDGKEFIESLRKKGFNDTQIVSFLEVMEDYCMACVTSTLEISKPMCWGCYDSPAENYS